MKRNRLLARLGWCALVAFGTVLAPHGASALTGDQEVSGGGVIKFDGAASTNWVKNADVGTYDFIITYTNATGSFTFPGTTKARILAVGGGGGGGGTFTSSVNMKHDGAPGGGGGGGVVETNDLFVGATYNVSVGAGGLPGAAIGVLAKVDHGTNGEATVILKGTEAFMKVLGGGGGGGFSAGLDGANGGGGSMKRKTSSSHEEMAGGAGLAGYAGGDGRVPNAGGGGGGAGGAGGNAETNYTGTAWRAYGGKGGDGVSSDITGMTAWYGGGGGGGNNHTTEKDATVAAAGGKGGGGSGGVAISTKLATAGENGKGGGGGGGNRKISGKGGDGVVIVRIAASCNGNLDKPKDVTYEYEAGTARQAIPSSVFYTVTGQNVATNVGTYFAYAKPIEGVHWTDGSSDQVCVVMTITQAGALSGTAEVTGAPIVFSGAAATNWVANGEGGYDLLIKFMGAGSYTLPGTTKARILAVGGGGGGGGTFTSSQNMKHDGAPGGGGGGALSETNMMFEASTFHVTVGAGGLPGAKIGVLAKVGPGTNGEETVILKGTEAFMKALGGGGGGGFSAGLDGANGGGGSMKRKTSSSHEEMAGGAGLAGYAGGDGRVPNAGGGGGGAGGAGGNAETNYTGTAWQAHGGKGGDGVASDITGTVEYYGGGGGGGNNHTTEKDASIAAAGGKGGGGSGGVAISTKLATAGTDGTGGGGGGGNRSISGKGGSGVVYVRISAAMTGKLERPKTTVDLTYDGKEHSSVAKSAFYSIEGTSVATDAGTYVATVKLKPGCTWSDGKNDDVTVTMTIAQCEVTVTGLTMPSWEYTPRKAELPEPTYTISPDWVSPIIEYAAKQDAPETEQWNTDKPMAVGSYRIRARLADTKNFAYTTQYAEFTISKRTVTITDLFQKDWMYGTPSEATPKPRCTIDPSWVTPTYEYADTEESETWTREKPTEIGEHWIRASVPDTTNYSCEPQKAKFKITKGLGDTFIDYVEITIAAYKGTNPEALTNFPYKVTVSEENPYGFLYSRTDGDGQELGVTDANGDVLAYRLENWDIHGESAMYIRLPILGPSNQVIRLYWKLREGATAPDHKPESVWEHWTREKAAKYTMPAYTYDLVVRNGYRVNRWETKPALTPTVWKLGGKTGVLTEGKLVEGTYTTRLFNAVTGEDVTFPPQAAGSYRYLFTLDNEAQEYEDLEYHIDFAVTASNPMDDLKGDAPTLTANGRVLIANDDAAAGHEVTDQSYWHTNESEMVYWEHSDTHSAQSSFPNLKKFPGSTHRLLYRESASKTNILWRLEQIILGNTFPATDTDSLYGTRVYLPWSSTGLAMSGEDPSGAKKGSRCEAGVMVMRNKTEATIYSPCYSGGIGTIYFDAANVNYHMSSTKSEQFGIEVDIATNVYNDAGESVPPTDENARQNGVDFARLTEERWIPVTSTILRRDNNAKEFTRMEDAQNILLDISKGGGISNFFRICVNLDCRMPVRFRIRRTGCVEGYSADLATSYIALDNILVSYPKSISNLRPFGKYDAEKTGKRIIGQEGAMSVAFPALTDGDIYGRATNDTYVSEALHIDPKSLVGLSRMHYRWRYLNQASNEWQSVDLSPFDDYVATEPLKIPYDEGDIEFFYESFMNVPFYQYYDYTGLNFGLGGLYTEETGTVTNRIDKKSYSAFYGSGDDWFVRMRAGKSEWDEVSVTVDGAYKSTVAMELIGDNLWRGLVKVPTNRSGAVTFRFNALQRRPAWCAEPTEYDRWWYPTGTIPKMPWRGETVNEAPKGELCTYAADDASGYIEFQFNDESGMYMIGHAEYQNFNAWHDARREDGKFVGSYAETSGVNVAAMIQTNAHMNSWSLFTVSNSNWNESFELANYEDEGYPKYTETYFQSHKLPHQWTGENGIFVDAKLVNSNKTEKEKNSGIAWQMVRKTGSASFTQSDLPPGIDEISFKARLAQSISFNDFSVWDGDDSTTANNYTFCFPSLMSAKNGTDYSPGASMSIVGYYRRGRGCYEFRVTRDAGNGLLFAIYKWAAANGGEFLGTCVSSHWFKDATFQYDGSGTTKPQTYQMFISLGEETSGSTTVIAGLSYNREVYPTAYFQNTKYRVIKYVDKSSDRYTAGGFGALTANCNGMFIDPKHWTSYLPEKNVSWGSNTYAENATIVFVNTGTALVPTSDRSKIEYDQWLEMPGRIESYAWDYTSVISARGLRPPTDMYQNINVYLKPTDGTSGWGLYKSVPVSSYQFDANPKVVTVRTNVTCQVQLKAGEMVSDVTLWDIRQSAWRGEDINNIDGISRDFIYTQSKITQFVDANKTTNRFCILQPARALPTKALSIRSPILSGLGMAGFSYRDVKPGAEIWLQVITNGTDRLGGSSGYNYSTKSINLGEPLEDGAWMTLRKYTYDDLGASGQKDYYLGWHTREQFPLTGVFRLFVPTNVVNAAIGQVMTNPEYGSITITDFYVHDEPAIDARSWLGWNLRTLGDTADSEGRMYLPDVWAANADGEIGAGLSAGLNNSYTADIAGTPDEFDKNNPYIQSPTFGEYFVSNGTAMASIGQVRFRARLYGKEGDTPAKVTIYAVADGTTMDWGDPVTNYLVSSPRYKIYEYRAPSNRRYAAVRLVVDGVTKKETNLQRVLLDEVVVSERSTSAVGFAYARPFRTGLDNENVIDNILDKSQQPLTDESWGVQTQLKLNQFSDDIDVDRGFRVTFRYYAGSAKWGYDNWADDPDASPETELMQVGAKKNYIFRSTASNKATIGPVMRTANTVVQYILKAYFYEKGNEVEQSQLISVTEEDGEGWTNPAWYAPVDYNRENNRAEGSWRSSVAPYSIFDSISPGRAWINEVNYNDGPKAQNGRKDSLTNQFVEIAVPWGVDMKGWVLRLTDINMASINLAILGRNGLPAKRQTEDGHRSGDYDFYVLESPATTAAGGIRDSVTGEKIAVGSWTDEKLSSTLDNGTMKYGQPYQLELVRPSGIVEHQFVLMGTNEWRTPLIYFESFGYRYEGTNLLYEMNAVSPNPNRFYAGEDLARLTLDPEVLASLGVTGGAHGEEGGWSEMRFTPGRLNEGQSELSNWYIRPNGGSCWVYLTVDGDHLTQRIGEDTSPSTFFIIGEKGSTNIVYTADPWYQLDTVTVTVDGIVTTNKIGSEGTYNFKLSNITSTTYVVASEGIAQRLIDAGLNPADRYAPAIMRWLENGQADGKAFVNQGGAIKKMIYREIEDENPEHNVEIGVKGMYWFDIDPTEGGWWLRGKTMNIRTSGADPSLLRTWYDTKGNAIGTYDNIQVDVKLYLSNETSRTVFAPKRLQGVANEQSDKSYSNWTSETFKIEGELLNKLEHNAGFQPFRWFVFGPDSFGAKGSANEFVTTVELIDPFSTASPGYSYGWSAYKGTGCGFRWNINEVLQPTGVEMLNKDSSYEGKRPFVKP